METTPQPDPSDFPSDPPPEGEVEDSPIPEVDGNAWSGLPPL